MNRERLVRIILSKKEKGNKKIKTRLKATTSIAFSIEKLRKFLNCLVELPGIFRVELNTLTLEE